MPHSQALDRPVPEVVSSLMGSAEENSTRDVATLEEVRTLTLEADLTLLEEDRTLAEVGSDIQTLLHQHDGHACRVDLRHNLKELSYDNRRQSEREFVDTEKLGVEDQRAGQGPAVVARRPTGCQRAGTADGKAQEIW